MPTLPSGVYGTINKPLKTRLFVLDPINYPQMQALDSHSMEVDEPETNDAVDINYLLWNTELQEFEHASQEVVAETIEEVTATIGIPAFTSSYLHEVREGRDIVSFFAVRHAIQYSERFGIVLRSNAVIGPIVENDTLTVANRDDIDEPEGSSTTIRAANRGYMYPLRATTTNTIATTPLYGVGFTFSDSNEILLKGITPSDIIVAGEDGTDAWIGLSHSSADDYDNRWDTENEISSAFGAGTIITSIVKMNEVWAGTWADDIDPATATDGGVFSYQDGAVTIESTIGVPMYAVAAYDGNFYFGGKGGVLYRSSSSTPTTITQITHAVSSEHVKAMDADPDNSTVYCVTESGSLLKIVGSTVTDISAFIPGSPSALEAVAVLGDNHVMIGGASGYIAEHRRATSASASNQYTQRSVNSGSGTVRCIDGNDLRLILGVDTKLFERSIVSMADVQLSFRELELTSGTPSGNIMAIQLLDRYNEYNWGVAVTAAGEVIYINPIAASV